MHPAIYWIIGALVGLILEMLVPAFVIGSFGVSAFFAALTAWFGGSLAVQIVVFGVLGFVFIVPARKLLHKQGPTLRVGAETMPGKIAQCVEPIDGDEHAGTVMLDGARWNALTTHGLRIERGAWVEIVKVDSARLFVVPRRAPQGALP